MIDKPPPVTVRNELRKGKSGETGEAKATSRAPGGSRKGQAITGQKPVPKD